MKKFLASFAVVLIFGAIVFVLLSNKAKMESKIKEKRIVDFAVSVVGVSREKVHDNLVQVGVITANQDVAVAAETQGKVTAVYVRVGSYVQAGSPLIRVDDELQRASFITAQSNYEKAQKDYERYTSLHNDELITDSQYESARLAMKAAEAQYIASRRQFSNSTVVSPISGLVTSRPVDIGAMIAPGVPVANVVDISKLKVKLNIGEQDVFRLKVGDSVMVETDVYPAAKFPGRIETISAKGDEAHTYPVEVAIANSKINPLKAGMFGRVTFNMNSPSDALVIPREALVGSIKEPQVYVVENGVARLKDIMVGTEADTKLTVLQGLNEGDSVVVNGQDNLKDNVKVTVIK